MSKWDIYLANVPFEDLSQFKIRPVLILDDTAVLVDCLKMTSHVPRRDEYALKDWKGAGLKKPTTIRMSKRLRLTSKQLIKKLGVLQPIDILEVKLRL